MILLVTLAVSAVFVLSVMSFLLWGILSPKSLFSALYGEARGGSYYFISIVFAVLFLIGLATIREYFYPPARLYFLSSIRSKASVFACIVLFSDDTGSNETRIRLFQQFVIRPENSSLMPVRIEYFIASSNALFPGVESNVLLGLLGRPYGDFGLLEFGMRFDVLDNDQRIGTGMILDHNTAGI